MKYVIFLLLPFAPLACAQTGNSQPKEVAQTPPEEMLSGTAPAAATTPPVPEKVSAPAPEEKTGFTIAYIMGKFDPAKHPDFVQVDQKYANAAGFYLRKDTYESFKKMWEAAQADGITLTIISATRNFDRQKKIWEDKWTGARKIENDEDASQAYPDPKTRALKILEYSSMPGTSRHHWGTDIDLNDLNNHTFEQGPGKKVYDWLQQNADKFGFCQPYTPKGKNRPDGYNEEKWHWSYIPVARHLTDLAASSLNDEMIGGFLGAEAAVRIGVVQKYVLGINKHCL